MGRPLPPEVLETVYPERHIRRVVLEIKYDDSFDPPKNVVTGRFYYEKLMLDANGKQIMPPIELPEDELYVTDDEAREAAEFPLVYSALSEFGHSTLENRKLVKAIEEEEAKAAEEAETEPQESEPEPEPVEEEDTETSD